LDSSRLGTWVAFVIDNATPSTEPRLMNQTPPSRIALAVIATAVFVSIAWILADRSAQSNETNELVWRYTNQGWQELSELSQPNPISQAGPIERISPLTWAALQLLAGLAILFSFSDEAPNTKNRATLRESKTDVLPQRDSESAKTTSKFPLNGHIRRRNRETLAK
jgi:hypothetical protein